jgi:hypothetical protein
MPDPIEARNLTAQLQYRAAGNPPSTLPSAAVSNSYPGLDADFRNLWTRLFAGIRLHEGVNFVAAVDADAPEDLRPLAGGYLLVRAGTYSITVPVIGPTVAGGGDVPLKDEFGDTTTPMEWSNALASVLHEHAGETIECEFHSIGDGPPITRALRVRRLFETAQVGGERVDRPAIAREMLAPGDLTHSLCAPWQFDYRYCECYYWAATRPDYVNVETRPDLTSEGNNWLQKDRTPGAPKVYIADSESAPPPGLVTTSELITAWARILRFVFRGIDEPAVPPEPDAKS